MTTQINSTAPDAPLDSSTTTGVFAASAASPAPGEIPPIAGSGAPLGAGGVCRSYFDAHPEAKDGVMKAYFAYHVEHFRCDPKGHSFTSGARESKCQWCQRSREMVRHDELPAECQKRPESADMLIADVILGEEQRAFALLAKAERIVPKIVEKMGMSGETLAVLHHTHGYDPETVSGVVDVPPAMITEYHEAMTREQARSRAAIKREIVMVRQRPRSCTAGGRCVSSTQDSMTTQDSESEATPAVDMHRVDRTLREIAAAICTHLKRMEGNPAINTETRKGLTRFYNTWAGVAGRYVSVTYIGYQGATNLTRADAEWYLKWLDGGGEGRHYEAMRERPIDPSSATRRPKRMNTNETPPPGSLHRVVGPLVVDGREFDAPLDAALHLLWLLQRLSYYENHREGQPCDGVRFREGIIAARKLLRKLKYEPGEAKRPTAPVSDAASVDKSL